MSLMRERVQHTLLCSVHSFKGEGLLLSPTGRHLIIKDTILQIKEITDV